MITCKALKGKTILKVLGCEPDRRKKTQIEPKYILFTDRKTYIELEEQDQYTFHDCSCSAKEIHVKEDALFWNVLLENKEGVYPEANAYLF
jgi:hypothetical protein